MAFPFLTDKEYDGLERVYWINYVPASDDALEKCEGMNMIDIMGAAQHADRDYNRLWQTKGPDHPDTKVVRAVLHATLSVIHQFKHHN